MMALERIRDGLRWVIRSLCADFLDDISRIQQYNLSTAKIHDRTFTPFKNRHCGQDVVVVACGPSAKEFLAIPNAKYIGVNHAIRLKSVTLDYLFFMDAAVAREVPGEMEEYNKYRIGQCQKFYGVSGDVAGPVPREWIPSESDVIKANALRFRTDNLINMRIANNARFVYDISTQPLPDFGSVIFSAIEFALWTNPKRIFLVGCDCTATGHFDNATDKTGLPSSMRMTYEKLKGFAHTYYPDTEIISVNPVGLKGLFRDWYQKEGPLK